MVLPLVSTLTYVNVNCPIEASYDIYFKQVRTFRSPIGEPP